MRKPKHWAAAAGAAALHVLSLLSCDQKELYDLSDTDRAAVKVVVHWDSTLTTVPDVASVFWFGQIDVARSGIIFVSTVSHGSGADRLAANIYKAVCFNDLENNVALNMRGDSYESFEFYHQSAKGFDFVPEAVYQPSVAQSDMPLYVDTDEWVDMQAQPVDSVITVHYYPRSVLREFTFMIHGIPNAHYGTSYNGSLSGMSSGWFPANDSLSSTPVKIIFSVDKDSVFTNAQGRPWSDERKALFKKKNPNWDDRATGWTGDWVIGKIAVFGPVEKLAAPPQLTLVGYNSDNTPFYASWGYWHGATESTVADQIKSAWGDGTPEAQRAWRAQNGGFDILLANDSRLLPEKGKGSSGQSGFIVDTDEWGAAVVVKSGSKQ